MSGLKAQNKNMIPELRFGEFDGDWVTKKLGMVCKFTQGIQLPQNMQERIYKDGYIRYLYIRDFFSDAVKYYVKDIYPNKIIEPHEIMMVNTGNTAGKAFRGKRGVLSNNSFKISFEMNEVDSNFLFTRLTSESLQKQIRKFFNTAGQPHLGHTNISQVKLGFASLKEQQKIANFLTSVDQRISLLKQKKAALEQYKKGLMQKIFSQEIRFKPDSKSPLARGDLGVCSAQDSENYPDWEEKRFEELYEFKRTNSFSRDKLNYKNGELLNIHYGDIHTKFKSQFNVNQENVPFVNFDVDISKIRDDEIIQSGDLIIADASEDYDDIGKSIEAINIQNTKIIAGLHTFLARRTNDKLVIGFAGFLMKSEEIRLQIKKIAQGTKVLGISMGRMNKLTLKIPSTEEQKKIADCLSSMDQSINKLKNQIEQTTQFKKGLLQRMFV